MTNNIWELLEKDFEENPMDFGGKIGNVAEIQNAENILGLKFSSSYIKFLQKFGSGVLPGHIIYGLLPVDAMGSFIKNVVEKTNFYKKEQSWPGIESWYIVSDDGFGNPIGIDPEGKVWLSDHDSRFEHVKLADSFEEFLYKLYTDTLYE